MDPGLLIALCTAAGGGVLFIVNRSIQIYSEFDKLKDGLRTETLTREGEIKDVRRSHVADNDALRKEMEYRMELQEQRNTMSMDRISEGFLDLQKQMATLGRTIEALHKRLDNILRGDIEK